MLHTLLWTYRVLVALVVGALVYDYFMAQQTGNLAYTFSEPIYFIVLMAALAEPVFWAVTHLCGGILMGAAAGGIWDGMKLSLILGIGLGFSRLWPHVLAAAGGVYAADGPMLYSVGGAIVAVALFALDKAMTWFWQHAKSAMG